MDMSGMDMGSDSSTGDAACKINMLFNWYTIDACFLTEQWHVRSVGGYVGSLIGVFFLVVALEAVRRFSREYERSIRTAYYKRESLALAALAKNASKVEVAKAAPFRPSLQQHLIRSVFYGVQFGTSYILMLLAMYFNVGILLVIVFGGGVGYLLFARDTATPEAGINNDSPEARGECCC
ncbi:hypothetical protein JCM10207_001736 [Rhodosporidiobolus poonsookiae]